jgi:hypothetical protein
MCAEIGRNRGENKRLAAAERGFEAKTKGRTNVLPLAACANAQSTPGSCLDTAWRGHAPSPPVFVAKTLCGHPLAANINLSLSLTRRQALWLAPANRAGVGAVVLTVRARLSSSADNEMAKALPLPSGDLQLLYLKLNRSA